MADDPHNTSDISDPIEVGSPREDSDTKTARRELKQTSISEKDPQQAGPSLSQEDKSCSEDEATKNKARQRRAAPDLLARDAHRELQEQISLAEEEAGTRGA